MDFASIRYTTTSPLARQLFQIDGVTRVFYGSNFISVTKEEKLEWGIVKPEILSVITEHYSRGQPLYTEEPEADDLTILETDSEAIQMIKEILTSRVRPFVQEDGGDISFIGFDEEAGIVSVQLLGACVGCSSSTITLKNGIENMLKHYIAEVNEVVSVEHESDDDEF